MRKTAVCTFLVVICALSSARVAAVAPHQSEVALLDSDRPIERRITRGEEHHYQLTAAAGELVRVVVEQKGIDVIARVEDSEHVEIDNVQQEIRRDGEERIDVAAEAAATYTLTVAPADGVVAPGAYTIRLASRRSATRDDITLQTSRSLRAAAVRLERAGQFGDARSTFERALALSEGAHADAAYAASLIDSLAGNALEMRDDARARVLYERAIAAFDTLWGPAHPYPAMARSRLALLDEHAGNGPQAEAQLSESLAIIQRTLGTEHLWYAQCLITQANLRYDAKDFGKAEEIDRTAIAILERIELTNSRQYGAVLNNLAEIYRARNDTRGARALYLRSLAIGQTLDGFESYRVSTTLQNLGIVAREQKDYASALEYDTRALSMRERLLGADHVDNAPLLNNLAVLYHVMGDDVRALSYHFHALAIWEHAVGAYHPGTLTSVGNIARTYASIGDTAKAIAFERRADAILEKQLTVNLAVGSERAKLAFARAAAQRTDRTISLHLDQAPDDPDASSLAALVLLQRKGRVLDAMTDVFAAVRQHADNPDDRALMDRLGDVRRQLAQVALTRQGATERRAPAPSVAQLEARAEQIEAALSAHSVEFRTQLQPVTLEAVQAAIPGDAALLEFAVFHPFDPKAERNADAYGAAHYAAYVVRRDAPPIGVDLGVASEIDALIDRFRDALRDPARKDVSTRARALDARVMQPLRTSCAGAGRLLISPDGALNLVPFEALVDEHGRYLIQQRAVSYLTSGRDLLRMRLPRGVPGAPVIVADPLFGEPAAAGGRSTRRVPASAAVRRTVATGVDASVLYFAPLSGTAAEARALEALFPEATVLTGRRAAKPAVQRVKAPRILHIASHGFFLDDRGDSSNGARNPLLRSGLALAGANVGAGARGDGILTALEASSLDLWGTKLVTLSACDTGVGEVRDGEGVYGLRRAFVLAGAETLVMSLWPVTDYIARDAMVAYYTRLRSGHGRSDALRQAKLALLKNPMRQHPYYWAGFIQSGEWADLNGTR